jgi:hypothetical protein
MPGIVATTNIFWRVHNLAVLLAVSNPTGLAAGPESGRDILAAPS